MEDLVKKNQVLAAQVAQGDQEMKELLEKTKVFISKLEAEKVMSMGLVSEIARKQSETEKDLRKQFESMMTLTERFKTELYEQKKKVFLLPESVPTGAPIAPLNLSTFQLQLQDDKKLKIIQGLRQENFDLINLMVVMESKLNEKKEENRQLLMDLKKKEDIGKMNAVDGEVKMLDEKKDDVEKVTAQFLNELDRVRGEMEGKCKGFEEEILDLKLKLALAEADKKHIAEMLHDKTNSCDFLTGQMDVMVKQIKEQFGTIKFYADKIMYMEKEKEQLFMKKRNKRPETSQHHAEKMAEEMSGSSGASCSGSTAMPNNDTQDTAEEDQNNFFQILQNMRGINLEDVLTKEQIKMKKRGGKKSDFHK